MAFWIFVVYLSSSSAENVSMCERSNDQIALLQYFFCLYLHAALNNKHTDEDDANSFGLEGSG